MQKRKGISFFMILVIALAIGFFIKNVKLGLIIGLTLGLLMSGLLSSRK
ncbi:MAG: hypothetical protein H7101_02915 [Deinococcales bacterium]|nr:hypothetical protein [Chitinophagaceae bacterium]